MPLVKVKSKYLTNTDLLTTLDYLSDELDKVLEEPGFKTKFPESAIVVSALAVAINNTSSRLKGDWKNK